MTDCAANSVHATAGAGGRAELATAATGVVPVRPHRVGIMGGTFDPIHLGHLVAAEEARCQFGLDRVIFMVAGRPALKPEGVTDPEHRYEMAVLATRSNPHFEVSRIEIDRPGITYTVDTIGAVRESLEPSAELYFITGADAVFEIIEWHDAERLAGMVTFLAVTRPGYDLAAARAEHERAESRFDIRYIEVPALAVSSTDIRDRVAQGRSIRYLVPEPVNAYIRDRGLYAGGGGAR